VTEEHEMVLCEQNLMELREVVKRKVPRLLPNVEALLLELSYELIPTSQHTEKTMRDLKDQPILNAAIHLTLICLLQATKIFLS